MEFKCNIEGCGLLFNQNKNLLRHMRGHDDEKKFQCSSCPKAFKRKDAMQRHQKTCNGPVTTTTSGSGVKRRREATPAVSNFKIVTTQTAFSNASVTWKLKYKQNDGIDYTDLLDASTAAMESHILNYQHKRQACKFNMSLHVVFEKAADPSIVTTPPAVLVTEQFEVYEDTNIVELLTLCSQQLQNVIECYEATGSGWTV